jgi:hypothetical protein
VPARRRLTESARGFLGIARTSRARSRRRSVGVRERVMGTSLADDDSDYCERCHHSDHPKSCQHVKGSVTHGRKRLGTPVTFSPGAARKG